MLSQIPFYIEMGIITLLESSHEYYMLVTIFILFLGFAGLLAFFVAVIYLLDDNAKWRK